MATHDQIYKAALATVAAYQRMSPREIALRMMIGNLVQFSYQGKIIEAIVSSRVFMTHLGDNHWQPVEAFDFNAWNEDKGEWFALNFCPLRFIRS